MRCSGLQQYLELPRKTVCDAYDTVFMKMVRSEKETKEKLRCEVSFRRLCDTRCSKHFKDNECVMLHKCRRMKHVNLGFTVLLPIYAFAVVSNNLCMSIAQFCSANIMFLHSRQFQVSTMPVSRFFNCNFAFLQCQFHFFSLSFYVFALLTFLCRQFLPFNLPIACFYNVNFTSL